MNSSKSIVRRVVLLAAFGLLISCNLNRPQNAPKRATNESNLRSNEDSPLKPANVSASSSMFSSPDKVCSALSKHGLGAHASPATGKVWGRVADSDAYFCISDELEVTPGNYGYVGDVPNTVTFSAESQSPDRVDKIELSADMFNEKNSGPVVKKLQQAVRALFDELNLQLPAGLEAALAAGRPKVFNESYGTVEIVKEKYNLGWGLKLVIRPRN